MLHRARLPLAVVTLALLVACQSDRLTRSIDGPMYAVSDGAHGGNPDFFFLPPLFKTPNDPSFQPATFNPRLRPSVEICRLEAGECVALVKRFGPGTVSVSASAYHVNWSTTESALDVTKFYRIQVFVGTTRLGFADVDPVSSGKDLKNVQTGEYIPLLDGRTLPIKFSIENLALCILDGCDAAASATINLAQGGGVELVAAGEDFHFDIAPGTQATTPGGEVVTDVTVNLEVCDGIDVDLPKFGQCLRVSTFFNATGTVLNLTNPDFTNPALISMCNTAAGEGQAALITMHQQDGDLVRALPHAHPNCEVIGARAIESPGFAVRGWHWVRDFAASLFTPRSLYAGSRTALLHLGAGGETNVLGAVCPTPKSPVAGMALATCVPATAAEATPFPSGGHTISDFQLALPAQMNPLPGTGGQTAAPGSAVEIPPGVKVTDAHGDPVADATVHFEVTAGNGRVTPLTVTSTAEGIAQVTEWVLGDAGTNTVRAFGFGIAGPDDGGPFMPDLELPPTAAQPRCVPGSPCQQPVQLATGEVTFTATGAAVNLIISSFTRSFATPTVADDITFTAVVMNVSSDPAPASRMSLRVGGETFPPSFAVPALAAGATFTVTRTVNLSVAQGYIAEAKADINNEVVETNETDNNALMNFAVTALTATITDATGDAAADERVLVAPDLVSASATVDGGSLIMQLRFAPGTFDQTKTMATVIIDIDQNTATGFPGVDAANNDRALIGAEYNLQVGSASIGATGTLFTFVTGGGFTSQKVGAITYVADGADVVIPLSALGGDRGEMSFKVLVQTQISFPPAGVGYTGIVDYMTDLGTAPGNLVGHPIVIGLSPPPRYLSGSSGESEL